ncbi:MAG: TetR/AcrR family transcriptional regulator [Candidatus Kapabacteria bacterium]|nr:TetR/AcrR family transcriptional regulator [Candidatus Kapabacteria bacterium]
MGVTERKIKEKEKRRKDILKAAKKIFLKLGYDDTSMDMIAEETQLSKGSLYLYFKSKHEIYFSLIEDSLAKFEKVMVAFKEDDSAADEALIKMAEAFYDFSSNHSEIMEIMVDVKDFLETGKIGHEVIANFKKHEIAVYDATEFLIQRGIDSNIFYPTLNTRYSVVQLWISCMGAFEVSKKMGRHSSMSNVNVRLIIQDLIKTFICANTNNDEILKKYRNDINKNAQSQIPDLSAVCEIIYKSDKSSEIENL